MLQLLGATLALTALAGPQQAPPAQLKLRIVIPKSEYTLNEKLVVQTEFLNLTSDTLCFPILDQTCSTPQTGWVVVTGQAPTSPDTDVFVCHTDARGEEGARLDAEVRKHWIKLAPNRTYLTEPAEAAVRLFETGTWRLAATYHAPEGSFGPAYRKTLKAAAKQAGCVLPETEAEAEAVPINVTAVPPELYEAVVRYQIDAWQLAADSYCIEINGKDAGKEILEHLQPLRVKGASACRRETVSRVKPLAVMHVVDKETKKLSVIFDIGSVRWKSDSEAEVDGGYECGTMCMAAGTYHVVRDGTSWRVTRFDVSIIS
ncbi:MAG TPA: hypothetical protein VF532_02660 [Candidatus Angelobacter sp.]